MKYRSRDEIPKDKRLSIAISERDHQLLKILAADQGITMSAFVFRAIRHYLSFMKKEEKLESFSQE